MLLGGRVEQQTCSATAAHAIVVRCSKVGVVVMILQGDRQTGSREATTSARRGDPAGAEAASTPPGECHNGQSAALAALDTRSAADRLPSLQGCGDAAQWRRLERLEARVRPDRRSNDGPAERPRLVIDYFPIQGKQDLLQTSKRPTRG